MSARRLLGLAGGFDCLELHEPWLERERFPNLNHGRCVFHVNLNIGQDTRAGKDQAHVAPNLAVFSLKHVHSQCESIEGQSKVNQTGWERVLGTCVRPGVAEPDCEPVEG